MRSKFEEAFARDLEKRKIKYEYEPEALEYIRHYIPDFKLTCRSGRVLYIETKGHLKSSDRTKMLSVRRTNPDLDIRIIFQRATERLSSKSKTTYGEWATANKFKWAEGTLPKEWINE